MKLLLDTHVFIWLVAGDPKLPATLSQTLAHHDLTVSTASIWELSIKYHLGKLPSVAGIMQDVPGVLASLGAEILNITPGQAIRAGALEWPHRDPFDRMLVAQALEGGIQLVTLDDRITSFAGAPVFRA